MYRIESEPFLVADAGVDFVVRVATDYAAQAARQPKGKPGNPFLEPKPISSSPTCRPRTSRCSTSTT